ncbi:drug/metabolite transporter (DMT)-like permease [Dysgonomonas sp. PFB1-18]|uniref:DMT family transporter n=1 Tax=unclassified Dysgonomonas TaxID=2630389 RepID=UPI002474A8CF|nr:MULTISPECIES: DMT family transporter [unclassified Dysgonomonas]MDH6310549.1 drug/metabolite transporter (DMT)-like permease [Dysgonomonas sp. PF1-14]MDH6340399.1 drug/metabolite transporter (DMT)-like permease [Dysgonomonas sp. PF1-16]MDH6382021.1 drug/metabolite transporter (DMT)-like permease [Dysgonomonas sp. PFB1-18]MDH6399370.1 drug/metabolite transporter (DMT)-like permease [Dysgonomonas sp. PF1-23]
MRVIPLIELSLLYPIGFFAFQIFGILIIPTSEASIIYASLPIFTLLASSVILKEKTILHQKIGTVLSVAGIVYIVLQSFDHLSTNYLGYFFILCSLLSVVFYSIFLKKILEKTPSITATYYLLLYAALIVNVANIGNHIGEGNIASYLERFSTADYVYVILYLGILSTLVTSFFTNYSLKYLPASLVGVFNNLSPVIGLFAGVIILHENLYNYYIYGGLLVLVGIAMSTITKNKEKI